MIEDNFGEVFVLYLNPSRRNEGIGTMILDAITKQQKEEYNATEQWVSVAKGNQKGIPFYEAKGLYTSIKIIAKQLVGRDRMSLLNAIRQKGKFLLCLTVILSMLSGCGNTQENISQLEVIGNPTPNDFLKDPNADIYVLGDIVYSNVADIDWVKELDYTIVKEVGEIKKQTNKAKDFENVTSNILPIGTKIYVTDTLIYIAKVDNKEIPYLKMLEG